MKQQQMLNKVDIPLKDFKDDIPDFEREPGQDGDLEREFQPEE